MLSFFRKLSIGSKIKDGTMPEEIMSGGRAAGVAAATPASEQDFPSAAKPSDYVSKDETELRDSVYDLLRSIKDPEKPRTLEELDVVYEDCVDVRSPTPKGICVIRVEFNPTVPHCSLATLIGLCIRIKLERNLSVLFKLDIYIKEGAHATEQEINKQINDKERIAAAMENPNLRDLVEKCIGEDE